MAKDYLAHNIRCNCISPARVHRPFVDGYLKNNCPDANRKCLESYPNHNPLDEWQSRRKSLRWLYSYVPMKRLLLPEWTIRWMVVSVT